MTVVGARPQFIKAAPVSSALRKTGVDEILVHTGQHYDREMSALFFEELELPAPSHELGVGSGPHGRQTGQMLSALEEIMLELRPDGVLVYGDTNSTLAGALAAAKLKLPLAHVESGLRSYNRSMPEEHNRVLTDHASDFLFCPTRTGVENLRREGLEDHVRLVGDTMYDAVLRLADRANDGAALQRLKIETGSYVLATLHRPYNVDRPEALRAILSGLGGLDYPVLFPVHPRTRARIDKDPLAREILGQTPSLRLLDPVGYLEMLSLERNARAVVTDSGGVQKEAYFLAVPCVTVRPETEWVETLGGGWNRLVEPEPASIAAAVSAAAPKGERKAFGDGRAAERIVQDLVHFLTHRKTG